MSKGKFKSLKEYAEYLINNPTELYDNQIYNDILKCQECMDMRVTKGIKEFEYEDEMEIN